ncbi:hypothetical protein [Lonsdalea iberica]|uniref:hypothetical protein n=1 Tax=Lonsdalea iberica TaxID=1082703 RepID=UPI00111C67F6|nr:hypothetical protein [Lonsdalea iberica]
MAIAVGALIVQVAAAADVAANAEKSVDSREAPMKASSNILCISYDSSLLIATLIGHQLRGYYRYKYFSSASSLRIGNKKVTALLPQSGQRDGEKIAEAELPVAPLQYYRE